MKISNNTIVDEQRKKLFFLTNMHENHFYVNLRIRGKFSILCHHINNKYLVIT